MSIVRNTVVLRNAALGALVVLALFECNAFVSVRFGIKGVFCKENRSNTLRTSRVHGPRPCTRHVQGRLHGPTRPVRDRVHGPFTAVYTRIRVHRSYKAVYAPYTRPCTRPVYSRIHGPCTRPVHGSVNVRVHGPCTRPRTRPVVYMAGRPSGPCTGSQTARYGRVRPITAVYTARSQPVYGSVYGRVQRPLHGRLTRAYVYTAVKRPCTRHVHVAAVGHVQSRKAPCTRSCTRPIHSRVHVRLHGPCTRPHTRTVCHNGTHTAVVCRLGTCTRSGR